MPLRKFLDALGRALLPPRCLLCQSPGAGGLDLCAACRAGLPAMPPACPRCALPWPGASPGPGAGAVPACAGAEATPPAALAGDRIAGAPCPACRRRPPPQAFARAAYLYVSPIDRLLPRLKFHDDLAAGRLLSTLLPPVFADAPRPQALLPLPLHPGRLRQRGYDQALELARPLARALGLPLCTGGLQRTRATAAQSGLDARERRRNLRGAFAVRPGAALPPHLVLFDDVMTTGATLGEAAACLRAAGVQRVDLWVVARAPLPRHRGRPGGDARPIAFVGTRASALEQDGISK